jgi:predicted TIM-barrel fold metal-dependent hydrolase
MRRIDRRCFLRGAAGALVAATAHTSVAANAPPIVDPHFHVWDRKRLRLPWLDNAGPLLNRDYSLRDYHDAIAGLNVVRSVYVEVEVEPKQHGAEARFAVGLCGQSETPVDGVVIGGRPGSEGFADYVRQFKGNRCIRGVRAPFPVGRSRDARFVQDIALLGELEFAFDLLLDADAMADAAELAKAVPGTRFILDHCGNASPKWFTPDGDRGAADRWRKGIVMLAGPPNVACKISGAAENGPATVATVQNIAPIVNHCLDSFGQDRVMFASNWPVCLKSITVHDWVEMLREIIAPREESFAKKLLDQNAVKHYRLST